MRKLPRLPGLRTPPKTPRRKSKPAAPPQRRPNVSSSAYDPETGHLTVTFGSGRRYRYEGVTPEIAKDFGEAHSQSAFLREHVIGKCECCEIHD